MRTVTSVTNSFVDPLYGQVQLLPAIHELSMTPAVQRLRAVRLSNIDSRDTPSIAGVSRFEHVLGTAYLAQQAGIWASLSSTEQLTLSAAALLHDIAITPFGHLMEEALHYAGYEFRHEHKLLGLLRNERNVELGGIELQIFEGVESGIATWARRTFASNSDHILTDIFEAICGRGDWGPYVAGAIDLDNLDNVCRLSHHMGLGEQPNLGLAIAREMGAVSGGRIAWTGDALPLLEQWLDLRAALYTRLMFAKRDFVGKAMLTVAMLLGLQNKQLGAREYEWTLTDEGLLHLLRDPRNPGTDPRLGRQVSEIVRDWRLGQLWTASPLYWLSGQMPEREGVWNFGKLCGTKLQRECYAHAIPDKRFRQVELHSNTGDVVRIGHASERWLLGVVSPKKSAFSKVDLATVATLAENHFGQELESLGTNAIEPTVHASLFG